MVIFSLLYGIISYLFSYYGEMITYLGMTMPMAVVALLVTVLFYFVLKFFQTANLLPSTLSVTTSFVAVYLTFRRSPYFSLAYAANDCILIILWILASMENVKYISVVVCFVAFLFNDIYGYVSWKNMEQRQMFSSICQ